LDFTRDSIVDEAVRVEKSTMESDSHKCRLYRIKTAEFQLQRRRLRLSFTTMVAWDGEMWIENVS